MKNVLIPTDFSIRSLRLIPAVCAHLDEEELNITLVHPLASDTTISALLRSEKRHREARLYNAGFREACEVIRNRFGNRIVRLSVEFYYGGTKAYLKHYLEARQTDLVVLTKDFPYDRPTKESRDIVTTFSAAGALVTYLPAAKRHSLLLTPESSLVDLLYA